MRHSIVRVGLLMATIACCAAGAHSATLNVGPGGYASIQAAIDAASDGDTVVVAVGTYNEHIDFSGKSLTVRSTNPTSPAVVVATIINGSASGTCVTIGNGEGQGAYTAVLEGFTITNGAYASASPSKAGGIHIANASPIIRNNVIALNQTAADGGGIAVIGSSVVEIRNNTISGNTAEGWGGGVFVFGGDATASVVMTGNRVSGNEAAWDGGGICLFEAAEAEVRNNVIDENIADEVGGGLFVGYAIAAQIVNNTVVSNEARGVDLEGGSVQRVGRGGGLACFQTGGSVVVDSCIFWANTAADGGSQMSLEAGATLSVGYSNIMGGQAGVFLEVGGTAPVTLIWGSGNIDALPLFASATDYHLQSMGGRYDPSSGSWVNDTVTSPSIDAGNPALAYADEPAPNGHRVNQGAYGNTSEASKTPAATPFLTIGTAQFDVANGLMYFDLLMDNTNGFTGDVIGFGARAVLSGADAGHFVADPTQTRYWPGFWLNERFSPLTYAWVSFGMGATGDSTSPDTLAFGHNTSSTYEAVALESIASGAVVARFYYAWDGTDVSEVFVNIESYGGYEPTPSFNFVGTSIALKAEVLNDGSNIIAAAGDPDISVATEDDLDWVYQNTPAILDKGGHQVGLTVTVNDLNGNDSVAITVAKVDGSGAGEVDIVDGDTELEKWIYGSDRSSGTTGQLMLSVVATGNVAGSAEVLVPFTCRVLGDIDGNGGAEPTDMSALVNRLNGMDTTGYHRYAFDLDSNGGAEPGDISLLVNILNGTPIP